MLYKIGDFSSKVNIPIKTLRYYDEIDLFKPSYIDVFSGYRYYESTQIKKIMLISNLKLLGLSLEEIKKYLENQNNDILINKKKGYEDKIKQINEFMNKNEKTKYTVEIADYRKYVELNGTKQANCPQALEVRDNNAKYFVVNKNDEYCVDFCIYKENKWLTLNKRYFLDNEFLDNVLPYIESECNYFTYYLPGEEDKIYSAIKKRFNNIEESELKQGDYIYKCLKISF